MGTNVQYIPTVVLSIDTRHRKAPMLWALEAKEYLKLNCTFHMGTG